MSDTTTEQKKSYGVTADVPWSGTIRVPELDLEFTVPSISAVPEIALQKIADHLDVDPVFVRFHIIQNTGTDEPVSEEE